MAAGRRTANFVKAGWRRAPLYRKLYFAATSVSLARRRARRTPGRLLTRKYRHYFPTILLFWRYSCRRMMLLIDFGDAFYLLDRGTVDFGAHGGRYSADSRNFRRTLMGAASPPSAGEDICLRRYIRARALMAISR